MYALIWTTTPWSLPSNQAVCYNPKLSYSTVRNTENNDVYMLATDLVESVSKSANLNLETLESFSGITKMKNKTMCVFNEEFMLKVKF